MPEENLISARAFCTYHQIEISFIRSLQDYGLLDATSAGEDYLLPTGQMEALEKMVRLHYDLNINLEGIDAINHLLEKMAALHAELEQLHSRLRLYEPGQ